MATEYVAAPTGMFALAGLPSRALSASTAGSAIPSLRIDPSVNRIV
jgi:hypothetical protein